MLHVICLNPAIDKIYRIPDFAAGEDYPGQKPEVRVGGKGVNVARVLSQLGAPVHLYGFLGEGGDIIRKEMEKRCVCSFFDVSGACRTTVNIIDPKSGRETVITEAGPQVGESDVRELMLELSDRIQPGDIVAASGSIIAGAPADIYAQISRICEEIGAKCALDAFGRCPLHFGQAERAGALCAAPKRADKGHPCAGGNGAGADAAV